MHISTLVTHIYPKSWFKQICAVSVGFEKALHSTFAACVSPLLPDCRYETTRSLRIQWQWQCRACSGNLSTLSESFRIKCGS